MTAAWSGWLARQWQTFWFTPAPALNLAVARVVFATHALWILGSRDLPALADLPAPFWSTVTPTTSWRFLLWPGHATLEYWLQGLAIVALGAAVCGLWARSACGIAALLLYHLAPLETLYWTPHPFERGFTITVLALFTLACARCADTFALRPRARPALHIPIAPEYRWPLQLLQLFLCQIYFFAGYGKLLRSGWEWATADNIRTWLLVFAQQDQVAVFHTLGPWLAEHPWLCFGIGVSALAFDVGFITVLVWPRLKPWLVAMAFLLHVGIVLAMNIAFLNVPQLLIFVDWHALVQRCARWRHGRRR